MIASARAPRVLVLVDTSYGWGRGLLTGIAQYIDQHRPWTTYIPQRAQTAPGRAPFGWNGDGIIARVHSQAMAAHLRALRVPVVNVSGIELHGVKFPRVTSDLHASGKLAAQHFLERGFHHFAYCGWLHGPHVRRHCQAFTDAVRRHNYTCATFAMGIQPASRRRWQDQQDAVARWLGNLPKPVAVLTWATQGLAVLDACAQAGLHVPEEVAVLSGDEDDLLYRIHDPPLSGVALPVEQIGYQAAALLDRLLHNQRVSGKAVMFKPLHVVARQSTDILAVSDPEVAAALRFIRAHAGERIGVPHVLRAVQISRRALERKFTDAIARSPAQEIRRVRVERAIKLLTETPLSVNDIARACGFGSAVYMTYLFRKQRGLTPLQYRKQATGREYELRDN